MRKSIFIAVLIGTIALSSLAACGGTSATSPEQEATSPTLSPTSPVSTPATQAAKLDASIVLGKMADAKLPVTNAVIATEGTDPNNLLGRPHGYTSRAGYDVPGGNADAEMHNVERGGVVEVFATEADANARKDYIEAIVANMGGLISGYTYAKGTVVIRIADTVKPSVAARFEAFTNAL